MLQARCVAFGLLMLCLQSAGPIWGTDPPGFLRLQGEFIDIVTDLPADDSLRELPRVFDAAMPQWCEAFRVPPADTKGWRATAYIMGARERFVEAGFLPKELPAFPHGYQWGDQLWVVEQPSAYYRRHLLLHEGTHWFMVRQFGSAGPPWLMEGLAEWMATHRWQDGQLQLRIIPQTGQDVPLWGRISLINQQLNDGLAPSLDTILRYDNRAHQSSDAYAWSWAAVVFLSQNPATQQAFDKLLHAPLRSDDTSTRQLLRAIQPRKALVRAEWSAMLSGLNYGFQPQRELPSLDHRPTPLDKPKTVTLDTTRGWQSTHLEVQAGQRLRISASGQYSVAAQPKPWLCEPNGVTLRYIDGQPLGKLLMAIATPQTQEPAFSERLKVIPIGQATEMSAPQSGQILLRINESGNDLNDNSGSLTVWLAPAD